MKQIHFILIFVLINALFIFLLVHKQSQIIEFRYRIQQLEAQEKELLKKEQQLLYILQEQKNLKDVKNYAVETLGMEPIKLQDVKKYANL